MKYVFILITASIFSSSSLFQKTEPIKIDWTNLEEVEYEEKYSEDFEAEFLAPVFGKEILKLDGKEIKISGIYHGINSNYLLLSKNRIHSTMCGNTLNNHPNEMIDLRMKQNNFELCNGDTIEVVGELRLNHTDPYELSLILEDTNLVE